jgi:hypothetical protein
MENQINSEASHCLKSYTSWCQQSSTPGRVPCVATKAPSMLSLLVFTPLQMKQAARFLLYLIVFVASSRMEPTAAPEDDGSVFLAQQCQRTSRIRVAAATPASTGRNVRARSAVIHQWSNNTKPQIRIAMFNIRSGRGEHLIAALRALEQLNVDVGLLTDVKLMGEWYTRHSFGYEVAATTAVHHSQGRVALCWRDTEELPSDAQSWRWIYLADAPRWTDGDWSLRLYSCR